MSLGPPSVLEPRWRCKSTRRQSSQLAIQGSWQRELVHLGQARLLPAESPQVLAVAKAANIGADCFARLFGTSR